MLYQVNMDMVDLVNLVNPFFWWILRIWWIWRTWWIWWFWLFWWIEWYWWYCWFWWIFLFYWFGWMLWIWPIWLTLFASWISWFWWYWWYWWMWCNWWLGLIWNICFISAAQKIKKLSETPATVPIVAKLCMFDSKNRKIAEKLVQPVTPHLGCFQWGLQWGNSWKWVFGHFMSWEHVRVV